MAQTFSFNQIQDGTIRLTDGSLIPFDQAQLQQWMNNQGGGGINIERAADGIQAITGIFEKFEINDLVDDERDARTDLKTANQKLVDYLGANNTISGPELSKLLKKQMEAQESLDVAQTEIGRALDRAVLVASGAAGAKALFSERYSGQGYGGGDVNPVLAVLGGAIGYKLLTDDGDNDRRSRRRNRIGVSTTPR